MPSVAIIDYGVGNLRSVEKAFAAVGVDAVVTNDCATVANAERLVLPGVGAFATCMRELNRYGFGELIVERVNRGTPLLGVCVGMQMLFEESTEFGHTQGLGLLKGSVKRFKEDLVVPHVGWNQIKQRSGHAMFREIPADSFVYFVHSYFCEPSDNRTTIGETNYGVAFASIVAENNICGVQFHPEKSQQVGLQFLKNFATQ